MKTAHYYASSKNKFVMISSNFPNEKHDPDSVKFSVTGKREAKLIAKLHNATPWNF